MDLILRNVKFLVRDSWYMILLDSWYNENYSPDDFCF